MQIEAGGWVKPVRIPINDRKCLVCDKLEGEYHFVVECSLYDNIRKQYIPKKYWIRPNMVKFIELINSESNIVIRTLGMFIYHAFILRNNTLYGT